VLDSCISLLIHKLIYIHKYRQLLFLGSVYAPVSSGCAAGACAPSVARALAWSGGSRPSAASGGAPQPARRPKRVWPLHDLAIANIVCYILQYRGGRGKHNMAH